MWHTCVKAPLLTPICFQAHGVAQRNLEGGWTSEGQYFRICSPWAWSFGVQKPSVILPAAFPREGAMASSVGGGIDPSARSTSIA